MPRGRLIDGSKLLLPTGEEISTFWGCDAEYLSSGGVEPGDFVSFRYVRGNWHAEYIRKVKPTPVERAAFEALARGEKPAPQDAFGVVRVLVDLGFLPIEPARANAFFKKVLADCGEAGDDFAFYCLRAGDARGKHRFVSFDYDDGHDPGLVAEVAEALSGEPVGVRVEGTYPPALRVALLDAAGVAFDRVEMGDYETIDALISALGCELAKRGGARRPYVLECQDGCFASLFTTEHEAAALAAAGVAEAAFSFESLER